MRQLLSSVAVVLAFAHPAAGQTQTGSEGSLFLLLPTGAQAVGMGQTMVAAEPGSEGIWWNPASIARLEKRELAIHHSKTVAGVGDALSFVVPTRSYGSAALSLNILNTGEQPLTDVDNNVIGLALPRDVVLAGSYAGNVTKRLNAGLSYKIIQLRVDCSGECSSVGPAVESTRAVDLGLQYRVTVGAPLTFGAAVRNLGGRLNSRERNDQIPLPTQVELGLMYRLKFIQRYLHDTELRASGSYINSRSFGGRSIRGGADLVYQNAVHLRAGYVGRDQRGNASAALGVGLVSGGFAFDIARTFGGLPAEDGQAPVYVSLRYLF
jgi:hypothetical protein